MKHRILALGLGLVLASSFPPARGLAQIPAIDYEALVGDDMRDAVMNSVILTIALTSKTGMSGGSFELFDETTHDEMTLHVGRFPFTQDLTTLSNRWGHPYIALNAGYLEIKSDVVIGTIPDKMTISAWSFEIGGGYRIPIGTLCRVSPGIHVLYSRTRNDYAYYDLGIALIRAFLDGIVLNWEVTTLTYGPSIMVDKTFPVGRTKMTVSTELTYLDSQTIEEDHPIQKASAYTMTWKNTVTSRIPLRMRLKNMPLALELDGSYAKLEATGELLDGIDLYEAGTRLHVDTSTRWRRISDLYVGAGYTYGDGLSGWTLRGGFDF